MKVNSLNQEMDIPIREINISSEEMLLFMKVACLLIGEVGLPNEDLRLLVGEVCLLSGEFYLLTEEFYLLRREVSLPVEEVRLPIRGLGLPNQKTDLFVVMTHCADDEKAQGGVRRPRRSSRGGEELENVFSLLFGGGAEVAPDEFAVLEEEGLALGEAEGGGDSEGGDDFAVGIGEEVEGEFVFILEGFLGADLVGTDAEDFDAFVGEGGVGVAQAAGLFGAAGGVGFGIKVH